MKQKDKEILIRSIPPTVLIVMVGTITKYNLIYTITAGIIGNLISSYLIKTTKSKN